MASYEITSKIQARAAAAGITLDDIRARYGSAVYGGVEVQINGSRNFDTLMAWIASAETPVAAPRGWSNASAHRAGRPTRSQSADYRRGYTQSGDTQTWDWS